MRVCRLNVFCGSGTCFWGHVMNLALCRLFPLILLRRTWLCVFFSQLLSCCRSVSWVRRSRQPRLTRRSRIRSHQIKRSRIRQNLTK